MQDESIADDQPFSRRSDQSSSARKERRCVDCGTPVSRDAFRCRSCWDEEDHPLWKGDDAKDDAKRKRAVRRYPLEPCERCGGEATDRHHIDKDTGNNIRDNIRILCRACHGAEEDGTPEERRAEALKEGKLCRKCEQWKPHREFSPDRKLKDGLRPYCRTCVSANTRRWTKANPDKVWAGELRRRREYPERHEARAAVKSAVGKGLLVKPDKCSRCGEQTSSIHGHHVDYKKYLKVIWLCARCHGLVHFEQGAGRI